MVVFVNVCVSLSTLDGAAKPSSELFSLVNVCLCSRKSLVMRDRLYCRPRER